MELASLTVSGVLAASFLALGAIGLTLTFGIARFANIAHTDYMTLGAYGVFLFNGPLHLPLWVSVILGLGAAIILGVASASLAFDRLRVKSPVALLIISIGVSLVLRHLIQFFFGGAFRQFDLPLERPFVWGPVRLTASQIVTLAVAVALMLAVHLLLTRTRLGRILRAMADNPSLCEITGADVERFRLALWAIVLTLASVAGVLFGLNYVIQPNMGWNFLIPIFSATILGGIGNPYGAMLGALVIGVGQEWSTLFIPSVYKEVVAFAVLAACLLLRPQGLWGTAR